MADSSQPRRDLPTREGYDLWSAIYDHDENPLVALEEPRMAAALGNVRGLRVLDVGCGTGRHALRMAGAGASVTAVDFSEGMLAAAKRKAADLKLEIEFVRHDIAAPFPFADEAFDRVVCGLVLDHVADVRGLFAEMGRVCARGGLVVASVMHPAMMLQGVQARFTDPASGVKTYPASVPNTISDYVMGALGAGLSIRAMAEHACDAELAARLPRAARYLDWPMLLMMTLSR
jgi:malonyl-CoA O-methyltransferase